MAKKIKYKNPDGSAYDAAPLNHYIQDEFRQTAPPYTKEEIEKWANSTGNRWADKKDTELIFAKSKTKKK